MSKKGYVSSALSNLLKEELRLQTMLAATDYLADQANGFKESSIVTQFRRPERSLFWDSMSVIRVPIYEALQSVRCQVLILDAMDNGPQAKEHRRIVKDYLDSPEDGMPFAIMHYLTPYLRTTSYRTEEDQEFRKEIKQKLYPKGGKK